MDKIPLSKIQFPISHLLEHGRQILGICSLPRTPFCSLVRHGTSSDKQCVLTLKSPVCHPCATGRPTSSPREWCVLFAAPRRPRVPRWPWRLKAEDGNGAGGCF